MEILTPTTKLEAVNAMLAAIGQAPANSLSTTGSLDVSIAVQTLERVNREVQTRGWHFNTDKGFKLSPDGSTGKIAVTPNIMQIDTVGSSRGEDCVTRGGYLWDRINHTFVFTKDLYTDIVWLLSFTDLPEAARTYIYTRAGRVFVNGRIGSTTADSFTRSDERVAMAMLKKAEGKTRKSNVLTGNQSSNRIINRKARGR